MKTFWNMALRSCFLFLGPICVLMVFAVQFGAVRCQSDDLGGFYSNINNDRIFEELTGEKKDNVEDEIDTNSSLVSNEKMSDPAQEETKHREESSQDMETLQTVLSMTSSGVSWLKAYMKDNYDKMPSPSQCVMDTHRLLDSALSKQIWTIPFIDAAGKPGPSITLGWFQFVGNLEQCEDAVAPPPISRNLKQQREFGFRGQYCTFQFALVKEPRAKPKFGLCVPDSCSNSELFLHSSKIIKRYNVDANITLASVECITNETEITTMTILGIILLIFFGGLTIVGTTYDIVYLKTHNDPKKNGFDTLNGSLTSVESSAIDYKSQSKCYDTMNPSQDAKSNHESEFTDSKEKSFVTPPIISKFLLAFSIYSNGKKILSTAQGPQSIGVIHGLRYLSIAWVVLGHVYFYAIGYTLNFSTELSKYQDRWTYCVVFSGFFAVDSFFTISGLLTSYQVVQIMDRKGTWKINWPKFYFHRFWRLTPPYMVILILSQGFIQYFGSGAMWGNTQPFDKELCEDKWWRNVLFINNFGKLFSGCMSHTWYLANDMQFFWLSPLIIVPLFLHPIAGLVIAGVLLLASMITTGVLSTTDDWPNMPWSKYNTPDDIDHWINDYYTKPWNRIGPYIIGILTGFLLTKIKGKSLHVKLWLVALAWTVNTAVALALVYGIHGDASGDHVSSTEVIALYNAVARPLWGLIIAFILIACDAGYGGPVNTFLSWKPFIVLGRLTFMTYLIHPYLIRILYSNMDQPLHMNDATISVIFLGTVMASTAAGFVGMILFESPTIGLEKIIFGAKKNSA